MTSVFRRGEASPEIRTDPVPEEEPSAAAVAIPAGDPLETLLVSAAAPVEVKGLSLQSEALDELRAAGVELIVPLVGQGELLGALYLGPRLSDQPYSTDDRKLLASLASQVAPAMRVAQLVQSQQAEAKERERINQELQVAALIQQTLLPHDLPRRPGWNVDAFYRPARAVGGDFYDFVEFEDGRLGVIIGDVTDKGVPAALVMATCRSTLKAAASRHDSPGQVLAEVNDSLVDEIPPAMFVTCLYAIIDTETGELVLANAGHNLPYVRTARGVIELRATGMPLGLLPGMEYEECGYALGDGEVMVLSSDGITEAHSPAGEMYGFGRLLGRIAASSPGIDLVAAVVEDVESHSGAGSDQEDDITLVVVRRTASARESASAFDRDSLDILARFSLPSEEGNERLAIDEVVAQLTPRGLSGGTLERLKTAVSETVMNAIEHGNEFRAELPVDVEVAIRNGGAVVVRVTDRGGGKEIPDPEVPDLESKLAGEQAPRGWGLFLIEEMVDEMRTWSDGDLHTVELVIGGEH